MESPVKNSTKRRLRKKKEQRLSKLLLENSKCPSPNLGIKKPFTRKDRNKNFKIREQYLGSFIQGLYKEQSLKKGLKESGCKEINLFEETIDLCNGDDSVGSSSPNVALSSPSKIKNNSESVIDLCQDLAGQSEVIDLTETLSSSQIDSNENSGHEPTVIDISEEDYKDDHNFKPDSDEIFVIGTFNKSSNYTKKELFPFSSLSNRWNNFSTLISCRKKLGKKNKKRLVLDKIINKNTHLLNKEFWEVKERSDTAVQSAKVEENIYINSPMTLPSSGLRPIIIDGSNVAFVHSNCNFSCKRLEICINYFKEKGHKVTAFVPQYRTNSYRSDNPQLLRKLERQGDVVLTPSKKIDGRNIVPYDDRFIVQTAVLKGGIIVSRDNFNDLLKENPSWAETIKYRTLAFTWVDDMLMFPKDPLGEHGPTLEDFLRFH